MVHQVLVRGLLPRVGHCLHQQAGSLPAWEVLHPERNERTPFCDAMRASFIILSFMKADHSFLN